MTVTDLPRPTDAQPEWLAGVLDRHLAAVAAGVGGACTHAPEADVRYIGAWLPGAVVCADCRHHIEPRTRADRVACGACHRDAALTAADAAVAHPTLGRVVAIAGLCPACHPDLGAQAA